MIEDPRVIPLAGGTHPQARIDSVDAEHGVCIFSWLDAEGGMVDSGGSIARFEVVEAEPGVFTEPSDEDLEDAIVNPPQETKGQFIERATVEVQGMLDARARGYGYDDIKSAVTYVGDPNPRFDAEGVALRKYRSDIWTECYAKLAVHVDGTPLPEMEAFMASLPAFVEPVYPDPE